MFFLRTKRTYPNDIETSYTYNDAGEMVTANAQGQTTYYNYSANGDLYKTVHPNGILDTRTYDEAGHLTSIQSKKADESPFYSRAYTYDPVGNPRTMTASTSGDNLIGWPNGDTSTSWQESYTYDSRDRLTHACMNEACSRYFDYSYDGVGNRLSQTTESGTTSYAYDAADELESETTGSDTTDYAYDLNGNETQAGSTNYAYNLANELVRQTKGESEVSYTYTGDGLTASRSSSSGTTGYAWDTSSDIQSLAIEGSKSYTYGEGPIGFVTGSDSYSYHTDSLGSVVELSNSSGSSVESYRYSPYGEANSGNGDPEADSAVGNSLRYAGQYLDSETDLYNMRAREYDPGAGRFLEIDPMEAGVGDLSVAVYVYVDDRPTAEVDPSGMCVPKGDSLKSPCMQPTQTGSQPKLVYPFPKGVAKALAGDPRRWDHATDGLPGYRALDFKARAGTKVLAVVSGRTWWEGGGTDPSIRPASLHSVYGWTFYLKSDVTGITYFYSHLQTRLVKNGPPNNHVTVGQVVGTLDNWHQWGGVDHLHLGATGPADGANIYKVYNAPQVKPL